MSATPSIQKLSLFALTAMVVGSMVGSGIFSLRAHSASQPVHSAPS